jgi:tetratricopeptide (TPR) repeat protein
LLVHPDSLEFCKVKIYQTAFLFLWIKTGNWHFFQKRLSLFDLPPFAVPWAAGFFTNYLHTKKRLNMKKKTNLALFSLLLFSVTLLQAQGLRLPNTTNPRSKTGIRIGVTDIEIEYGSPGVKGREGKIWGTQVANYGFINLGFGSAKESPWRAGADENTTISFSDDVKIEGKKLAAGKYGFAIALYPDSCVLVFSKNHSGWGTYFYNPAEDALRVTVHQQKDLPQSREWLAYTFSAPTKNTVVAALEWEHWRIPFTVETDFVTTSLANIKAQMSGALGFDPPSLQAAAQWCVDNDVNYEEALFWIESATNPNLGGMQTFNALSTKANILRKLGREKEAETAMSQAFDHASVLELHGYGRQLLNQKKYKEALAIFEKNYAKNGDTWPTHVGLMRGYSANGDLKKALEHGKKALAQAPDDLNRNSLQAMVKTLEEGKPLAQ